ncbi:MAG: hypothetical protein FJZ01_22255 [Candidatus Sericytochromatia bacterium]|nr:hypothetical protein [Candidatus Tanganyikabacteria bacterium]
MASGSGSGKVNGGSSASKAAKIKAGERAAKAPPKVPDGPRLAKGEDAVAASTRGRGGASDLGLPRSTFEIDTRSVAATPIGNPDDAPARRPEPEPLPSGKLPDADEIAAASGSLERGGDLVRRVNGPTGFLDSHLKGKTIIALSQHALINTISERNQFGMANSGLGTRTASDIIHLGGLLGESLRTIDQGNRAAFDAQVAKGDGGAMDPSFAQGVLERGGGTCGPFARVANAIARNAGLDSAVVQAYDSQNIQNGHDVIVLNLAKGAVANDASTWGPDAVYVDPQNDLIRHNDIPEERKAIQNFLTGYGRDVVNLYRNP